MDAGEQEMKGAVFTSRRRAFPLRPMARARGEVEEAALRRSKRQEPH